MTSGEWIDTKPYEAYARVNAALREPNLSSDGRSTVRRLENIMHGPLGEMAECKELGVLDDWFNRQKELIQHNVYDDGGHDVPGHDIDVKVIPFGGDYVNIKNPRAKTYRVWEYDKAGHRIRRVGECVKSDVHPFEYAGQQRQGVLRSELKPATVVSSTP